jgi:4-amino-4-deoxy-L-arabinose transferase-like glycosyltransferase
MWQSTVELIKHDVVDRGGELRQRTNRLAYDRTQLLVLLGLVVVSLVLRMAIIRVDRVVRWDEPDYLIAGRNLLTGKGYAVTSRPEIHYAPLFPVVTGLLYPLTHDMKLNSDICYVLFGTLTLLPFHWLARRLFGLRIALMATAFLALFPALTAGVIFWGTMLEPLYLFLLYAAFCAVWLAWDKKSLGAHLAAGALLGLAYLAKPEAIVYLGLMFALLVVGNLLRRSLLDRRVVAGVLGGVLAFALVISPYLGFLYRHTGRILITGKLGVTYVAGLGAVIRDPGLYDRALSRLDEAGEEIIWFSEDRFKYSIGEEIRADPRGFLRRIWLNANALERVLFARDVFPFCFLLFLGLAWFGSPWSRVRAVKELFLVAAIVPVFIFLPFHIELRYFAPMLPVLLLWLAGGIGALADWMHRTWTGWGSSEERGAALSLAVCALLSAAIVIYFAALQPRVLRRGLEGMNPSRRQAGLWLRANAEADALVLSRDPEVPFYAERNWVASPNEEYPRFIAYVRKRGADYLVVDEREVTVIRPQLSFLLDETSPPAELRHIYTADDPRGKTIVYKVLY